MSNFDCDVAIIGAGPTGQTVASLLGLAGVNAVLIERNESTVQAPRAVSIDDESLRTMQACGMAEALTKDMALDYGAHYLTSAGTCFAKVEPTTREYGWPRRSAFHQPKLEATLRDGLARFPNLRTLFRHSCEKIVEDADGVTLSLVGPHGERSNLRTRYVAGCDGAHSFVRKTIGATLSGATYQQRWLIVDLAATRERLRQTRVLCDPKRPAICLPGPGNTRRYEFMLAEHEGDPSAESPDFVRRLLAAAGPDADAPVARRQVYTFHARMIDRWNTQRLYLAGDAAHLTPPFAGQGMNSGVRDAHNLAWKLAEVVQGRLGPKLLESYQKERAPHAWALIQLAINLGKVMMPTSPLQARLVQTGFRALSLVPSWQAYFAQMKYKPKPFYSDGFFGLHEVRDTVGRMIPQPLLDMKDGAIKPMDDVIGNGFAVIAYGPNAEHNARDAARCDFGLTHLRLLAIVPSHLTLDPDPLLHVEAGRDIENRMKPFGAPVSDSLFLVRPDRYVAAAVKMTRPEDAERLATEARRLKAACG